MKYLIFIIIIFFGMVASAQQQIKFEQFFINDVIYNPAISGSKSFNPLVIQSRQQWIGFDDAPFSTSISYHQSIYNNTALGINMNIEKSYPSSQANLNLNYAYHIPLNSNNTFISFGIGPKVMFYSLNFSNEDLPSLNDPAFNENTYSKFLVDISTGVYLYSERFSLGFSSLNILQSSFNGEIFTNSLNEGVSTSFGDNKEVRHYYINGSYKFNIINNDWEFEPSILISKAEAQITTFRIAPRIIFLKDHWAFLSICNNGSAACGFGFKANNLYFGYSYGQQFNGEITNYNFGSHELTLTFKLFSYNQNQKNSFWY